MPANVETMFYVREAPWHGLGTKVEKVLDSDEALKQSGLDWKVRQSEILTNEGWVIPGFKANIRDTDQSVLGVVSDRYNIVQNTEAFRFTDELLGAGLKYETAGSLQGGKKVWLLAKLPENYIVAGDRMDSYLVFSNSHDGTGSIRVAVTPIRVVCQNTLNLALSSSKRSWATIHTGNIEKKLDEAGVTLGFARNYMNSLGKEIESLSKIKISKGKIHEYIELLLPEPEDPSTLQLKNLEYLRESLRQRYFEAPDLSNMGNNAYRFINAVSDFATHSEPVRKTLNYKENIFAKTIDGNPLIDRAYSMMKEIA